MAEGETRPSDRAGEDADGSGRTPIGQGFAKKRDILALTAVMLVVTVVLTTVLVEAWPPPATQSGATGITPDRPVRVRILWWRIGLLRDARLFLVVLAAGGMGALIHSLRSLYEYVGNRQLRRSWLLMYSLEPFVGAVLALVVYLLLRGGLTTTLASSNDINPYGVAGMAALVGMFSRQTVEKLLAVFETLLAPAQRSSDRMTPDRSEGADAGPASSERPGTRGSDSGADG
ncbi:hypothetical protein ACIHFB_11700 [Streptomyces sp. NPDC051963]|uniref:hypothetical protein n=1 Tax=Streptomyces sp. NPDC051963 TaxID=3365678 RepID=UPI0037D61118